MTPQYDKMCSVPVWQSVLKSAFPAMASMLAASVYNLADTYFVSRLGSGATGAVGIVFSLMALIQAVGFTVGMGAGSVISRTLGKKEKEGAAVADRYPVRRTDHTFWVCVPDTDAASVWCIGYHTAGCGSLCIVYSVCVTGYVRIFRTE